MHNPPPVSRRSRCSPKRNRALCRIIIAGIFIFTSLSGVYAQTESSYYAYVNQETLGPFSEAQLEQMFKEGRLTKDTQVYLKGGGDGWVKASAVSELAYIFDPSIKRPVIEVTYLAYINRTRAGPYTIAQLKELAASGDFTKGTQVFRQGWASWVRADTVPELAQVFDPSAVASASSAQSPAPAQSSAPAQTSEAGVVEEVSPLSSGSPATDQADSGEAEPADAAGSGYFSLGLAFEVNLYENPFCLGASLNPEYRINDNFGAGMRLRVSYDLDSILIYDGEVFIRWYMFNGKVANIYLDGASGANMVSEAGKLTTMPLFGLSAGVRLNFGAWYVEPYVRGGVPFLFGGGLAFGRHFK